MADLKPPQPRKKQKPVNPKSENVVNLKATEKPIPTTKKPLQVKIPVDIHKEFKIHATTRDIDLSDLFLEAWQEYKNNRL